VEWPQDLLDPDEVAQFGLTALFGPGAIVGAFVILNFIVGWAGAARIGHSAGVHVHRWARNAAARRTRQPRGNVQGRTALTLAVLVLQTGWVALAYYVGNSIAILVDGTRGDAFPSISNVLGSLRWDAYSYAWLGMSILLLLFAYLGSESVTGLLGFLVMAPGYVYGFCGLVGGALNSVTLVTGIDSTVNVSMLVYMFTFGVGGVLYVVATRYSLDASTWARTLWRAEGAAFAD
jgi:hypothetical protein